MRIVEFNKGKGKGVRYFGHVSKRAPRRAERDKSRQEILGGGGKRPLSGESREESIQRPPKLGDCAKKPLSWPAALAKYNGR